MLFNLSSTFQNHTKQLVNWLFYTFWS